MYKLLFLALLLITCESYTPPSARPQLKSCALKPLQPQHSSPLALSASLKWRDGDVSTSMAETTDDEDGMRMTFMMRVRRKINAVFQLKEPGALILIRHGETSMNYNKTFTGWIDTDLSDRGVQEMFYAARLLLERGYTVDATYTSRLKRAIRSSWIMYSELGCVYRPVYKSWRLNERMYGALEGTSKPGAVEKYGEEVVQSFRNGLKARPPPMSPDHPNFHAHERKYTDLDPSLIPESESLQDTMDRTLPLWHNRIKPDLLAGRTVMVVAHANSIRGILKHIDGLSEEQIRSVGIPNGIPLVYKFDKHMTPIANANADHNGPLRGEFLEKKDVLRALLAKEEQLALKVPPHYLSKDGAVSGSESDYMVEQGSAQGEVMDARLRGLSLLKSQRMRFAFGGQNNSQGGVVDPDQEDSEDTVINDVRPVSPYIQDVNSALAGAYYRGNERGSSSNSKPATEVTPGGDDHVEKRTFRRNSQLIDGDFIVMIRHGRTEYNKLGIFTGWEDAPLAREGRAEARAAGKLLKLHGIHFDIVYTSWLSRAIETAWLVLDELNCLWLPIVKTWRLNERMYGALTGLSKKMIAQKHGNAQFMKWRRGYDQRPPQVSSFCSNYPGNDDRYMRYATDLRFSTFESIIRTLSHKRLELHRKFPKTESLQDCMRRTIPFFTGTIMPKSVNKGKTVLIASSENAIRGLLMHLCGIPEDRISEVEIPTGLPLVYSFRSKKIRLLEDGTEDPSNPLGNYNFGSAPELLFNSCPDDMDDDDDDDVSGAAKTKTKKVMVDPITGVAAECFFFPDGRSYAYDPLLRLESAPSHADLAALASASGRPPINVKVSPPPETASTPGGNDKLEAGSGI